MIPRTYYALCERRGGNPVHLLVVGVGNKLRCHCDFTICVRKDRTVMIGEDATLKCSSCQEEREKWRKFWARQDEMRR